MYSPTANDFLCFISSENKAGLIGGCDIVSRKIGAEFPNIAITNF
jgi:hypothetical protein